MEGAVHIDQALTNVSVGYSNGEYVAERVAPVVPVTEQSGKYWKHGLEAFTVRNDLRAPGDEARESRWTLSTDTFFCDGHALKDYVPREKRVNADPQLDLLTDSTEILTDQILLNQEVNLVAALAAGMTPVAQTSTPWDNDTYDPVEIIEAQMLVIAKAIGKKPNQLTLSAPVFSAIRNNSNVKGRITGAANLQSAVVTSAQLAALLEIDDVIVARAIKNAANEAQTASMAWVWGEYALLQYRPPSPGRKTVSLAYTFHWSNAFQGAEGQSVGSQFVDLYYVRGRKSDAVEVHKYYDEKIIDANAGILFSDTLT